MKELRGGLLVLVVAGGIAFLAATREARSWNDGSRLATVESLVERGTWAIDDSVFVKVPQPGSGWPSPYAADDALLQARGTQDKLLIDGHYYSDKSPVPALPLAGLYGFLRWQGMLGVADDPATFCWVMCLASAGLAYVVAVFCVWRIGLPLGLGDGTRLLLTASFAVATVSLTYARAVNNHVLLLAIAAAIWLQLAWLAQRSSTVGRFAVLGLLAGLAYTIDLGAGPPLLVVTFLLACWRGRSVGLPLVFLLAALPCVALHHGLTYLIAGTWLPANALPEFLAWPGSPFNAGNITGTWGHESIGDFALYALDLLFGKKGFVLHNLPVLLALVALPVVWLRAREKAEVASAALLCLGVWLVYAAGSTNASGGCVSVRWFVPLLVPAFYVLALALREYPTLRADLLVLSLGGVVLAGLAAWVGPWSLRMVPGYWYVVGGTLVAWAGLLVTRLFSASTGAGSRSREAGSQVPDRAESQAAA